MVNTTITSRDVDAARSRAATVAEHAAALVSGFAAYESKLRLSSAREFAFARVLGDASDCELVDTPRQFAHAPRWLHAKMASVTGKTLGLLRKVQRRRKSPSTATKSTQSETE